MVSGVGASGGSPIRHDQTVALDRVQVLLSLAMGRAALLFGRSALDELYQSSFDDRTPAQFGNQECRMNMSKFPLSSQTAAII